MTAALVALAATAVLGVARWLTPSPAGHGTHEQLGLATCTFLAVTGYPCPTCGMTTAFAWAVRGRWLTAARVQPLGFLLALATMLTVAASVNVLVTGRTWSINWFRISPMLAAVVIVGLFLSAWAYTILTTLWAAGGAAGRF